MNRISRPFRDLDALLEGVTPARPLEALLIHRAGLIQMLRRSLGELHEHRRLIAGTPAEPGTVQQIRYWEEVFDWVKDQQKPELVLMNRAT